MQKEDINWSPLIRGGSSFKTRVINTGDSNKWIYELSGILRMFPWFLISIGSTTAFLFIITILLIPFAFIPLIFVVIGIIWRKRLKKAIVFDFGNGFFWRGKTNLNPRTEDSLKMDDMIRLDEVAAIQILAEEVKTKGGNPNLHGYKSIAHIYDSYEMNLVLKDKSRVNVVDHANLNSIKREAEAIAKRLNVKVWLADNLI